MEKYLQETEIIDWKHPEILELANQLSNGLSSKLDIAKKCFEFVRDEIKHSYDYGLNPVTYIASDVLKYKTGYCYAKSHLLAALLRANKIPAGFCYQRLCVDMNRYPYSLHGLNAVYFEESGWYRIDARGNNENVNTQFTPPIESLACIPKDELECDFPEIWPSPLEIIVSTLKKYSDYMDLYNNLPDVEIIKF